MTFAGGDDRLRRGCGFCRAAVPDGLQVFSQLTHLQLYVICSTDKYDREHGASNVPAPSFLRSSDGSRPKATVFHPASHHAVATRRYSPPSAQPPQASETVTALPLIPPSFPPNETQHKSSTHASPLPATAADWPALGRLDAAAFLPTEVGRAMAGHADPDSVAGAFARLFERLERNPKNVLFKAVRCVVEEVVDRS